MPLIPCRATDTPCVVDESLFYKGNGIMSHPEGLSNHDRSKYIGAKQLHTSLESTQGKPGTELAPPVRSERVPVAKLHHHITEV